MRLETATAIDAAQLAQRIAGTRDGAANIISKGGVDIVTATDIACEDAVRAELHRVFPDYAVVGEERPEEPVPGVPYWLVDPICGTRPFASSVPLYCTNIALVENGAVTVAAVALGVTGELLFAEAGGGAFLRTGRSESRLAASDSSQTIWIDGTSERAAEAMRRAMVMKRWYVWKFSSSVSFAYLAAGRISGIVHFGGAAGYGSVHSAAGALLTREAGAILTDADTGLPWTLKTRGTVIAATRELETQLIDLCGPAQYV